MLNALNFRCIYCLGTTLLKMRRKKKHKPSNYDSTCIKHPIITRMGGCPKQIQEIFLTFNDFINENVLTHTHS